MYRRGNALVCSGNIVNVSELRLGISRPLSSILGGDSERGEFYQVLELV